MPASRRNNSWSNTNVNEGGSQNSRVLRNRREQRYTGNRIQFGHIGHAGARAFPATRTVAVATSMMGSTAAASIPAASSPLAARPSVGPGVQRGLAAAASTSGLCGYDARFESPLDKKYVCPVCLSALRDPLQTKCGHRFCATCLARASGSGNTAKCPLDKLWFDVRNEVFEDVAMKREVLSLNVLCSNIDNGCDWKGELRTLDDHVEDCPHAMVQCSNGCLVYHKRMDTDEHQKDCPSRLVDCTYCQQRISFKAIKQHHLLLCPSYCIECPLCGKPDIKREEMAMHTDDKNGDCPKAIVPCMFGEIGCNTQVSRCDLELHCMESLGLHLRLLLGHYVEQVNLHKEQGALIQELQEDCNRLTCQRSEANSMMAEMRREAASLRSELAAARTISPNGQLHWKVRISARDFATPILSPPFYTSHAGYKLRLCLELRGHVTRSDSYTSLFIMLCKGEHDDDLYFPFSATCALTLFDQGNSENHLTTNLTCQKMPRPQEAESQIQRRGRLQFMKTDTLINGRFCKAGTLFFQAKVQTMPFLPADHS